MSFIFFVPSCCCGFVQLELIAVLGHNELIYKCLGGVGDFRLSNIVLLRIRPFLFRQYLKRVENVNAGIGVDYIST